MSSNTTTPEPTSPAKATSSPRRRRAIAVPAALTAAAALTLLTACGSATPDLSAEVAPVAATSPTPAVVPYTGQPVNVPIPEGAAGVTITAVGGGGGGFGSDNQGGSLGAQVTGEIPLSAGEQLIVSVGQEGRNIKTDNNSTPGGWGGLGGSGGAGGHANGVATAASGGGASTVQLVQSPTSTATVLVAGGGGGAATGYSQNLGPAGGNAGTNVNGATATGDAGHHDSQGGAAGAAGAAAAPAGTAGTVVAWMYGIGGGGGGGLLGGLGGAGGGTGHQGGGGGAGSSMFEPSLLTNGAIAVAPGQFSSVNGQVTVAWTMS